MATEEKNATISQMEQQHRSSVNDTTQVKTVANVALADATERQKPSPWTKRMFMVSL
jgi:hypothetical protein